MSVSATRLYITWTNMKQRCYNSSRRDFPSYGGRGITVCDEWRDSFPAFERWAMENGYRDDLTLDRSNVNGPYCPGNCQWATRKHQANNRRSNRLLTMDGRTQTMQLWSDETGIDISTLWRRLHHGWTVERALTEPVHVEKRNRRVRA